jgi:uncharacterized protein YoxC
MESNTQTILTIFVALTGVAVLLQACVLFAIYVSLRKTAQSVQQATEDLKATVVPMVHSTRELMERITPQVVTISAGLSELTEVLHKESKGVRISVADVRSSVAEIVERVNRQTARLDAMVTSGLNTVEKAGSILETAVAVPVRQANGILAAVKAVIETYRSTPPRQSVRYPDPEDSGI